MKKVLCILLVVSNLPFFTYNNVNKPVTEAKPFAHNYNSAEISNEKIYHDALSAFLYPHIQKAIDEWSSNNSEYHGGTIDPWHTKILSVERVPKKTSNLWFLIKVEVMPYVLAHISVGRDHITFMLKPTGEVTVEKIERIESYDYLKWRRFPHTN